MPIPIFVRIPDTVECAIARTSAISAPVIRRRRSAAIASTRRSSVRLATVAGADERSSRPSLALVAVALKPLARGAVTDSGRLGGLRQRPPRELDTIDEQLAP